ncbi:MAG TPA: Wzz/FepE/Etk N-terminal domain-containing protein, partial [Nitrospiria bacterium]|nr:Wzz/FepE/Etk N-terminal domain-containing protein [Nitrospiria bacterium]
MSNALFNKKEKQASPMEYVDIIWRRKWWLAVPVLVSLVVAAVLIRYLPKTYRSSTLIIVEAQKVPEDYVKSAVSGTIEDRLATIRQQILSRSLLQKMINELGLYKEELKSGSTEEVLEGMRKNIEIKTDSGKKSVDAFTISFEGNNPKTVMEVTNKLASLYIEENLRVREQLVEGTTDFLQKELQTLKTSLDKQEDLISQHKKKFMGSLPQQLDSNLRSLDRYQMELQTLSTSLMVAEEKKLALEGRARGETASHDSEDTSAGKGNGAKGGEPGINEYASLAQMKETLENLKMEYTDEYPDVITLKRKIKELEASLSRRNKVAAESDKDRTKEKGKGKKELLAQEAGLGPGAQRQLEELNLEINSLKEREQTVTSNIRRLEKMVDQTPVREQEVEVLLRDYENTKKGYQSLLDKKLNAELSENLEKRQKGEQFRILDPANLPQRPSKPDEIRLFGLCLGTGFAGGLGLV